VSEKARDALAKLLEVTARLTCDDVRMYHLPIDTTKLTMARMHAMHVLSEPDAATARVKELEEALPDPVKLRILAEWLDLKDRQDGRMGQEVQNDLREWANRAEALLAQEAKREK